jgi:hypothetical protein
MATGSGAKESEAHKDSVKPSATWAGTFSLISLNLLMAVVESSLMTNKGSVGFVGLSSQDKVQMLRKHSIKADLRIVEVCIGF